MTLLFRGDDGRIDFADIGTQKIPWTPSTFMAGLPAWLTPTTTGSAAGAVYSYIGPEAGSPRAVMTTPAVINGYAELVSPLVRLSHHRALWFTVGGWYNTGADSSIQRQIGFYTNTLGDGGVSFYEDGTVDTQAKIQVRRTTGTVVLPQPYSLVSNSEYQRRRTLTMLLYRHAKKASEWYCAMLTKRIEEATDADVIADVPIFAGNAENAADVHDGGTINARVRLTAKAAVARTANLHIVDGGTIAY